MEDTVKQEGQSQENNLVVLPYDPSAGVYTEDALVTLYNRLKIEGLYDIVFHENPNMSLLRFMNFFSDPSCLLQICSTTDGQKFVDTAGMSWVCELTSCDGVLNRAVGSFVFFKDYQKPIYTDPFGEEILKYWFEVLGIHTVVGVTPSRNLAARAYVRRLGFKEVGIAESYTSLGGKVDDGVMNIMTRDRFRIGRL